MRLRAPAWLAFLAVLALAGCTGPPVWTPDVAMDAPEAGGLGPRRVEVRVVGDQGPVPATVILAWLDPPEPNGTVHVHRLGLRGPEGVVHGRVPDDRPVHVMAAGPGTTEEWVKDAFDVGSGDEVEVRVYGRSQGMAFNDTWSGAEVGVHVPFYFDRTVWHPTPLQLSADPAANLAMQQRIVGMDGRLAWENTPTAFGDLGILAATRSNGSGCEQHDDRRDLGPGHYEQTFHMPYTSRCNWFPFFDDVTNITPPIDVGPATSQHLVAPLDGVPYSVEVQATLAASWGWQPFEEAWGERDVKLHWAPVDEEQAAAQARAAQGDEAAPGAGLLPMVVLLAVAAARRRLSRP